MIKRNVIYNFIYQIFIYIVPLITTPYLTRILGASSIGEFSFAYSVATYFALFSVLGLTNYGNREISRVSHLDCDRRDTFWEIYSTQIVTGIVSLIVYLLYAFVLTEPTLMKSVMVLYVISFILDISWFYFGMELFKVIITRNVILKITSCLFIFIFVKGKSDAWIYGLIISVSTLLSQIILWVNISKYVGSPKVSVYGIKARLLPNAKLFIPVIAVSIYKIMDKIMLGIYSNNEQVGFYESSERLISIPVCFVTALGTVMLPRISNMLSRGDQQKNIKMLTEKSLVISVLSSSLISFGMIGVLDEFIPFFFGQGYEPCKNILMILLPSTIFVAQANVIRTQVLIPYQKDNVYIISVILGALVNLISNLIFIPRFGAVGAAFGTLLSEGTVCIFQNFFAAKYLNVFRVFVTIIPIVLLGYLMMQFIDRIYLNIYSTIIVIVIKAIIGFVIFALASSVYLFSVKYVLGFLKHRRKNT